MKTTTRKTIVRETRLEGVGLHSGENVHLRFRPAEPGDGITFIRTDQTPSARITLGDVCYEGPPLRSTLKKAGLEIHTVEHLLAALHGTGITDLQIELDGPELPGMDGSALPYFETLRSAGILDLEGSTIEVIEIKEPVSISDNGATITAHPNPDGLRISYTLDYPNEPLAQGTLTLDLSPQSFEREFAPARTFCPKGEAEALRAAGFGKGASTRNTLILDGASVIENTLRFPDETIRHKMLDLVGDIYLLGRPIHAHLVAHKSGHALNRKLAQTIATWETNGKEQKQMVIEINEIKSVLPHRYPFLLIDRIIEITPGKSAVGIKNVTGNESFFEGHFPGKPIMPGVLILEALAQTGAYLVLKDNQAEGQVMLFAGMDKVAFRRQVVPGDQLRLEVEIERFRPPFGRYRARAYVGENLAAEAIMKFMLPGAKRKSAE